MQDISPFLPFSHHEEHHSGSPFFFCPCLLTEGPLSSPRFDLNFFLENLSCLPIFSHLLLPPPNNPGSSHPSSGLTFPQWQAEPTCGVVL